ncbi:hypothetical protein NLJ89_g11063 [Agrocybe chaxingu]|uniref:Nudix hydrolase domain-containing protein n=1 Tax=Agrocybe chaxingu TaxID=84603 RepID=A0A9W8JXH3_9AGAR|nr:hypothetical protein NLJ89_g11063 [Agrocybe chaxingu]
MAHNSPKILSTTEMATTEAKWITLKKIKYIDQDGKERLWEYAERTTRKSSGVDGVAVLAILKSKTNSFPLSTVIIEQYRPPIGKYVIGREVLLPASQISLIHLLLDAELPAGNSIATFNIQYSNLPMSIYLGLIDESETAEQAAIRELYEETGYKATRTLQISPIVVSDPGMTNANMQLVVVSVDMDDQLETPDPKLEAGEFIVTKVVELAKLKVTLGNYDKEGFVVDARLSHLVSGFELARQIGI